MRILVDADSTNRIDKVENIARKFNVPVMLFANTLQELQSTYSDIIKCDAYREAADITLFNHCLKNDIVITNDIGLAGIVLAKGALVLHGSGRILDNKNIELDMAYRAVKQKIRRDTKHMSQSRKAKFGFEKQQKYCFGENLVRMIQETKEAESQ